MLTEDVRTETTGNLIGLENERGRERMITILIILLCLITMTNPLFID
jgi:hypothetical protein